MIMETHQTASELRGRIDKLKAHYKEVLILGEMKCVIFTANQYVVLAVTETGISPEAIKIAYMKMIEAEIERLENEFSTL